MSSRNKPRSNSACSADARAQTSHAKSWYRVADELHQVLVRGHDGRRRLGLAGEPRIGGDQVVGLKTRLFQARDVEGLHRLADQRELCI